MPKSVLAKNFRTDVSAFDHLPLGELYIFPCTPAPANLSAQNVTDPAGNIPTNLSYSYHFSQQQLLEVPGGNVKIIDSTNFPIAKDFDAALVTVHLGAMRELHWHLTSDESVRFTVYKAPDTSGIFSTEGDVGYIPVIEAHYLENTGTEDFVYDMLLAPRHTDVSVVVKDHSGLPNAVIKASPKTKPFLVSGNKNLLTTNLTGEAL